MALRLAYFLMLAACATLSAQQSLPRDTARSTELRQGAEFPVEVRRTVSAKKAHAGEVVEFTTIEAVLAGPKLVIPENARIVGHVVDARPLDNKQYSVLRFIIDEIRWKQNSAPMKAVIAGIGRRQINLRGIVALQPTFLEGTIVGSNMLPSPTTILISRTHDVVLHGGTLLVLKQIPDSPFKVEQR